MKKFAVVLALVLVCSLLLSGCSLRRFFDSDYDNHESIYYNEDYIYDDYDYNYDNDYDYDYNYGTTLSDFEGFWEKKTSYSKVGLFVSDNRLTLFLASPGEQYTFDDSVTFTIKEIGSSFYLYIGSTKEAEIEIIGGDLYLSGTETFNGYYDSVYVLDVDLD